VINRQSGVIIVHAMPAELRDVADYLSKTAETVTRQVILEAKVVEVQLSNAYQAGINWAAVLQNGKSTYTIGQLAPNNGFDVNPLTPQGAPVTISPGNPIVGFARNSLGGAFTLAADFANFNTLLELLSTQGNTRVLSSPRVSTLHNQKAIIKAGADEFFVTGVQSNTVTGTATSTSRDVQLTPFFSGVALDVTPQIGDDGTVILHIHPTISDVTDQTKTLTVDGTVDTIPLALSQIRESDSIVKARSGQLIVIGGLMRHVINKQDYKTPFLGDVPGVGRLFRSERDQSSTVELVILLRPLVVDDGDWPALVKDPTERLDDLSKQGKLGGEYPPPGSPRNLP
jgi:MSHA biogenesis protein MshL